MAGINNFKERAIEYVTEAVAYDNQEKFEQAFESYMKALDQFSLHCKYDKNPASKEMIQGKMREYMSRAEYLKSVMNSRTKHDHAGDASTAMGQKKKASGTNESDERSKMREQLGSSIVSEKPDVKWEDVSGLEHAKDALKEAVILPVKFPQFFTGKRKPWRGILLYGPPGTGKSYLAKAVATEADSTFFSVSSSDLVSKWMGESEKLVSELFAAARADAPAIIFIDEVDSLVSARGQGESEAARRIKTEFLVQMDVRTLCCTGPCAMQFGSHSVHSHLGASNACCAQLPHTLVRNLSFQKPTSIDVQGVSNNSDSQVLILGATNMPGELDPAIRRRFDKRIYIPLPDSASRGKMFKIHLGDTPQSLTDEEFRELGNHCDGFSGSDVSLVVKDTLMQPVRKVQEATHFRPARGPDNAEGYWEPCAPSAPGAQEKDLMWFGANNKADKVLVPPITVKDFYASLQRARPTVSKEDLIRYEEFTKDFGEEGI